MRPVLAWLRLYLTEILVTAIGAVFMLAIFLADAFRGRTVSAENAGQLGDFVGGFVGTGFLLLSVVLLIRTLRSQGQAFKVQLFESRFFDLVKLHRDNVVEMRVQENEGRRVFIKLTYEFRAITEVVDEVAKTQGKKLDWKVALRIAYYCLFFGAGLNSSRMLKSALNDLDQELVSAVDLRLQSEDLRKLVRKEWDLGYEPFEGHQSRLGHYFRHLYQTVQYADIQSIGIDKYAYVKTLRAQLSTHEQALLLINSLTPVGQNWWERGFIIRYKMVKNLPPHFLDPIAGHDIATELPEKYFEWENMNTPAVTTASPSTS